ncbi:sulfate adenylyltransferase, partial [Escherichia coli]|nr:sulfate adenylyltransferase [Escherichia coli]
VLELLENLNIGADLETDAEADLRLPIDYVIRDHATEYRGYAGRIAAGSVRVGDVVSVDANRQATVTKITVAAEDVTEAVAGQSVAISLDAEFDLARGDLISGTRPE